jgi:uncharacterized repeat protein (TIGR03803 family)
MFSRHNSLGCLVACFVLVCGGHATAQHLAAFPFIHSKGSDPHGGVIVDTAGNFYGTTTYGGSGPCANGSSSGCGVVYRLSQANGRVSESVLYAFTGGSDGGNPIGDLVFDSLGNLYGTTSTAGASNAGTVFELSPPSQPGSAPWTENTLYTFTWGQ